jgi:hypothetical protein
MRTVWDVLNTIQKRWRADSKAVTEAEEQKKIGELPVLKSRVTSQRDLLKSALEAALEHAHPDVLYQLGQIKPFLYLCYQFLANRFHSKDYDGPLSAVIYEVLSHCGTLTSELLEETKLIKALASMKKHANEKHKAFIQQVIDSAAANSKKAKTSPPPRAESTENKSLKRPAAESMSRSTSEIPMTKKPKASEPTTNAMKKDPASGPGAKPATTSSSTVAQKRPGDKTTTTSTTTSAPVKTRVSQVSNKPSGIFASLTAASKKPATTSTTTTGAKVSAPSKTATTAGKDKKPAVTAATKPSFSFAQTMASLQKPKEQEAAPVKSEKPLPAETPEEKARRLRKESRRHLRVAWRPDASLVETRYFDHGDDDDEMKVDKEDHLVRDAGDIGGEGRMFKQHKELDMDDDDEELDVEKSWAPPSQVDFSVVPPDERNRNYVPFGGGEREPECPEREANKQREDLTLMVYYSHADDIPPSPQEPPEQAQEIASADSVVSFGTPPEKVLIRCPQTSVPEPDMSMIENIIKHLSTVQPATESTPMAPVENTYAPPPSTAAPPLDHAGLQNILSALQNNYGPPQPPPTASAPVQMPAQPIMPYDISALMANVQAAAAAGNALPPPPPFPVPFPFTFPPQPQQNDAAAWPPQMHDAATYQPQMQSQYNQQTNGGTKRQRDDGNNNTDRNQGKRPKNRENKSYKVLECKFYRKGQCNKGDNCTYIHDQSLHAA